MGWHRCASLEDIWEGGVLGVDAAGVPLALYRLEGQVYATSNICTHATAHLSDGFVDGHCIECPLHQALFDIRTGEVRGGPAEEPLKIYPTRIEGNEVYVDLEP